MMREIANSGHCLINLVLLMSLADSCGGRHSPESSSVVEVELVSLVVRQPHQEVVEDVEVAVLQAPSHHARLLQQVVRDLGYEHTQARTLIVIH